MVPGVTDNETEKLIREKDEEVRHGNHDLESPHQQHEHEPEHQCDLCDYLEAHPDQLVDEALWEPWTHQLLDNEWPQIRVPYSPVLYVGKLNSSLAFLHGLAWKNTNPPRQEHPVP